MNRCGCEIDMDCTTITVCAHNDLVEDLQAQIDRLDTESDDAVQESVSRFKRIERLQAVHDAAEIAYSELAFVVHDLAGRRLYTDSDIDRRSEKVAKCADELRVALDAVPQSAGDHGKAVSVCVNCSGQLGHQAFCQTVHGAEELFCCPSCYDQFTDSSQSVGDSTPADDRAGAIICAGCQKTCVASEMKVVFGVGERCWTCRHY